MLLAGSTAAQAESVVTRIREHCAAQGPAWAGGPLGPSSGTVEFDAQESAEAFVCRADAAMYREKASRRR